MECVVAAVAWRCRCKHFCCCTCQMQHTQTLRYTFSLWMLSLLFVFYSYCVTGIRKPSSAFVTAVLFRIIQFQTQNISVGIRISPPIDHGSNFFPFSGGAFTANQPSTRVRKKLKYAIFLLHHFTRVAVNVMKIVDMFTFQTITFQTTRSTSEVMKMPIQ